LRAAGVGEATNPRRKEKPWLPQPEPSMTVVKTHFGLCLFGVRMRRAMQMQMDAITADCQIVAREIAGAADLLLMGANHRIMRCSQFVGKEQIVPNMHRTKMASRTV